MKTKIFLIILLALCLTSCGVAKISLASDYFINDKKLGIIQVKQDIGIFRQGQGILDRAISSGNKYKEPLETVDKEIKPNEKIVKLYQDIFSSKGKNIVAVNDSIDIQYLEKFKAPKSSKIYYTYDLRHLKSKHNIDELLLVDIKYGLFISYYGMIELSKKGYCNISSTIINLEDNSILSNKSPSIGLWKLKGEWNTPPNYNNLKESIAISINNAIQTEKVKF